MGRRLEARGSAKVQSGAKLLCKSAKVRLGVGVGIGVGVGRFLQVSGLGSREPGSGVQVRVQVQDLNFPHPHLYLITRTRDLKAETWDPRVSSHLHLCTGRRPICTFAR